MGKPRVHWMCFLPLKVATNFRRCPLSKRSLLIAAGCVLYLFFVVSQVGHSQLSLRRRTDEDKNRRARGLYIVDFNGALPDSADSQTGGSAVVPTRSNVVYITLKSKRLKPAHIRGTVRPKLRRKVRRNKPTSPHTKQSKLGTVELDTSQIKGSFDPDAPWKEIKSVRSESLNLIHKSYDDGADSQMSSIRIYSQRAPPWFSAQDLKTMRFLADAKVLRMKEITRGGVPPLLIFEGETTAPLADQTHSKGNTVCGGQCGIIHSPVDNTEVFAFHLDRVLGLNRTLPAVSRKFGFAHGRSLRTRSAFLTDCGYVLGQ